MSITALVVFAFVATNEKIPHISELAFIERSSDISLVGSVVPASCESTPHIGDYCPVGCTTPWGAPLAHGASVTAYQSASVPFGGTCVAGTLSCNNGTISGSYTNASCAVQPPANCPVATYGTCELPVTVHSAQAGQCNSNYTGTCQYSCFNGTWTVSQANSCIIKPDLSVVNTLPASGAVFKAGYATSFGATVQNSNAQTIAQGGWAGLEVDWNSDGSYTYYAAPNESTQLGAFARGESKSLSYTYANLPLGNHRYRFNVDSVQELPETNESNNVSSWTSFRTISGRFDPSLPSDIDYGDTVSFTWTTQNTSGLTCTVSGGGESWTGTSGSQTRTLTPTTDTVAYTLSCGGVLLDAQNIRVHIEPELSISPRTIEAGSQATLSWNTHNNNEALCTLTGGEYTTDQLTAIVGDPSKGSLTPTINGRTTYTLVCPNLITADPDDIFTKQVSIEVIPRGFET